MNDGICYNIRLYDKNNSVVANNFLSIVKSNLSNIAKNIHHVLHPQERKVFEGLTYPDRQHSYLLGRMCAKLALIQLNTSLLNYDININNGVFEFPYVAEPALSQEISISHSGDIAIAIAFNPAEPMAIDIENINVARVATIHSQLLTSEIELLQTLDLDITAASTMFWTIKESLSKVLRCGLLLDLKLLEITDVVKDQKMYRANFKNFPFYSVIAFKIDNSFCAIVFPQKRLININAELLQRVSD